MGARSGLGTFWPVPQSLDSPKELLSILLLNFDFHNEFNNVFDAQRAPKALGGVYLK